MNVFRDTPSDQPLLRLLMDLWAQGAPGRDQSITRGKFAEQSGQILGTGISGD